MYIKVSKVYRGPLIINGLYCMAITSALNKKDLQLKLGLSAKAKSIWKITNNLVDRKLANNNKPCLLATHNLENNVKPDDYFIVYEYQTTNKIM